MADIKITDLTNKTDSDDDGTGIFDLLNVSIALNLKKEFEDGKITGPEYSQVYLGALQATLQQAVTFLLSEQEASKKVDLLDKQIEEAAEHIDLVVAQTAKAYEDIAASQAKTNRENLVNNKQIIKLQKETLLVEAQTTDQQYITATIRPAELLKIQAETQLIDARKAETLAATVRSDLESAQKVLLMAAQTLGFASDTKQKLLKQMQDGFAVALSIAGVGNVPEANQDKAIDDLTQELLVNIGSSVVIESEQVVPVL